MNATPTALGMMAYAYARLRAEDEARSAQLERDRRVYRPDPDEGGASQVCVICEAEFIPGRPALVCPACRAGGWTPGECRSCGAHLTARDRMTKGQNQGTCKSCREEPR